MTASTAKPRALADTNIVVYAYDLDEPSKHTIARELLQQLSDEGRLVFSSQVFNEFCSVMMRPSRKNRLSPSELEVLLRRLATTGEVVPVAALTTLRALAAMPRHGLSSGTLSSGRQPRRMGSALSIPKTFRTDEKSKVSSSSIPSHRAAYQPLERMRKSLREMRIYNGPFAGEGRPSPREPSRLQPHSTTTTSGAPRSELIRRRS
jgi:predicted nucleic acid-binding protein